MRLLEITLLTNDLPGTERFYSRTLGFPVLEKTTEHISFAAGYSTLTFHFSEQPQPQYHFAFNIPHNQLDEAIAWSVGKFELIPVEEAQPIADFSNWNAKAVYFFDNNNNIVEFIARFGLENASANAFSGTSIECISEIGVVANEPLQLAARLKEENGLSCFSRGPVTDHFVPVGTDEGLLIIVATSRNWYPTNIPAQQFATRIRFETGGTTSEITF